MYKVIFENLIYSIHFISTQFLFSYVSAMYIVDLSEKRIRKERNHDQKPIRVSWIS